MIRIRFKNGHMAALELSHDNLPGSEALKEFHATCIMIYNI